jgi:hypothetical protein
MQTICRIRILLFVVAACALTVARPALAGIVVGTFNSTRASLANLANGPGATQIRASLAANFPGSSFATSATLTSSFLNDIDVLMITSADTDSNPITPLSSVEQAALLNYVKAGGTAFLMAEGYSPFITAAQSMIAPFGMTIVDDGLSGLLLGHPTNLSHPVFDGPFGDTPIMGVLGAGIFTNLGPYAHTIATMDANGKPIVAAIESHAIGPNSGRVVMITDASLFADNDDGGFFSEHQTLFLNTMHFLVPEPSGFLLGGVGLFAVGWLARRRQTQTSQNENA